MSLLGRKAFANRKDVRETIICVNPSSWVDVISTHEAALLMTLEQKDFKPSGSVFSKEDNGGGFLGNGDHVLCLTRNDFADQTQLKSIENHGRFWIYSLTGYPSLDYDKNKEKDIEM